jgi:hypothetical protein
MKFASRTMPLKAGARANTPPLEANKIKYYEDKPSACCGELHPGQAKNRFRFDFGSRDNPDRFCDEKH